jgi:hypothetical protein
MNALYYSVDIVFVFRLEGMVCNQDTLPAAEAINQETCIGC